MQWRVWKITNVISGNENNRGTAVTGSDLVAYWSPIKTVQPPFSRNSVFVLIMCNIHPPQ